MNLITSIKRIPIALSFLFLLLTGCNSIRLISEYDEITDKSVTALQEKVSKFFVTIEDEVGTEKAKYENHKLFYQEAKVNLSSLQVRANAIEKNKIVQDQISSLSLMIEKLETLHKIGFPSIELITPLKQPFNSAFTAIIKLQMGLKRGEKNN